MSADWTTCRVVRDRKERLWGRDSWTTDAYLRRWVQVGTERHDAGRSSPVSPETILDERNER